MPADDFVAWLRERERSRAHAGAFCNTTPMALLSLETLDEP